MHLRGDEDALADGDGDARRDGGRRHVRPRRRRLPPLLGRPRVARAALREDALRQRAARRRVPPRLGRHRQGALPASRRGDARLHAARAALAGGRLRLGAGRRHRRRRGADVHVDARRAACRDELLQPFEHGRFIIRGELDEELRAAPARAPRASGRSRRATTRRSRPGTASRSPRSPRPAAGSTAPTASTRRAELGRVPARPALDRRRPPAPHLPRRAREGHRLPRGLRGRRATACYELHVATGELRWLEEANRLARLAVELFGDDERGGFFLTPADGEQLVARKKDFDDHPTPSGNSMLAYVLLRLARIYGDDELERRAVGVFRLVRARRFERAPSRSAMRSSALDLHFSPPRELAIVGRAGQRGRPRRARAVRSERGRRLRPGGGRAAARGQGARRRQARRLRLRALRLPGAGRPSLEKLSQTALQLSHGVGYHFRRWRDTVESDGSSLAAPRRRDRRRGRLLRLR